MMETESGPGLPIYHVQLAAYRKEEQANTGWTHLTTAAETLLAGRTPIIRRVDLGPEKGIFFRLQTGRFAEQADATRLCRGLLAQGIDCMVVKATRPEIPHESALQQEQPGGRAAASLD